MDGMWSGRLRIFLIVIFADFTRFVRRCRAKRLSGARRNQFPRLFMDRHDNCLTHRILAVLRMLEGRAVVGETDMSQVMQGHAMLCAYEALDLHEVTDYEGIARFIKKKFDETYGFAWQCVVGFSFGSSITHMCGGFIYFRVERLAILLFKDVPFQKQQDGGIAR